MREQEKGSAESWLALGGRHEIGTQLFHFASVLVFACGRVSYISLCVRVSMFFCVSVCVCVSVSVEDCASGVCSCSGAGKWSNSNSVGRVNGTHNNKYVQFAYKQTNK